MSTNVMKMFGVLYSLYYNSFKLPTSQVTTYSVSAWSPDKKQKNKINIKKNNSKFKFKRNSCVMFEGAEKKVLPGW